MSQPAQTTLGVGVVLILIGLIAYFTSGSDASPTALIPALVGLVFAVLGWVAMTKENARKHAMHATAAVALLGALGSIGQLVASPSAGSDNAGTARLAGIVLLVACVIVLAVAIRSFKAARSAG